MKNKHKRQFLNAYKWYDYSFLLMAMEDWLDNASKVTRKKGMHLNADKVAKKMKICAELCKRVREDAPQRNEVFTQRNWAGGCITERFNYHEKRRKANLSLLTTMLNKHLLNFWD